MSFSITIALTAALFGSVNSAGTKVQSAADRSADAAVVYLVQVTPPEHHSGYVPADVSTLLNLQSKWITCSHTSEALPERDHQRQSAVAFQKPVAELAVEHNLEAETFLTMTQAEQTPGESDEDSAANVETIDSLFSPIHALRADGASSAPPELPEDATLQSLDRPQTLASPYLNDTIPGYYVTTGYGVRRAPRNTHRFYSHPLYYEEVNLERCGRSKGCCTTACSAVHFAARAAMTPYLMTLQHHDKCVATLPDCPTCHKFGCDATCPEWSLKAALVQGAAVTGVIYAIP